MELVDPFMPQHKPTRQQARRTALQSPITAAKPQLAKYRPDAAGSFKPGLASHQTLGQTLSPRPIPTPQTTAPLPTSRPVPTQPAAPRLQSSVAKKTFAAPVRQTNKLKAFAQTTAIVIWALALGLGVYSQTIGELAIAAYALVTLLFRLNSRISFGLALCAFAGIGIAQSVKPETNIAANFAVYAFLLLAVGTVSLWLEVRQQARLNKRPIAKKHGKPTARGLRP